MDRYLPPKYYNLLRNGVLWMMIKMGKNKNKIAIIGNGCAGAECIIALRESGYTGEIHVFTDSKWPIYNPMLTTYFVSGKINFDQFFYYGKGNKFYRKFRVDVHPTSPVVSLNADKRVVANKAGFKCDYDQCLIASGASPFLPPIEGIGGDGVYLMRTVEDAVKLKSALVKKPRKALVIGASMIGIKLVELFYKAGMEICLVDVAEHIFPLIAHAESSRLIEDRLRQMGIKLKLGANMKKIEGNFKQVKVYFSNSDENEEADLVIMCVGVRANTGFIDRAQVEVQRGVIIEEHMHTNVPGLYSAGDVSQGNNILTGMPQIIGLWANARYQGRTAGRNMAGIIEAYNGNIPHNITNFMGMDFVGIGDVCEYDRMEEKYVGKRFLQLFWKDKILTGANFVNTCNESGIIKNALVKGLIQNRPGYCESSPLITDMLIRKILSEVEKV